MQLLKKALIQKKITNIYIRSFLYYIPYACLTAMTFPAILYATKSPVSGAAGLLTAVILALRKKSLITVAGFACIAVFIVERILGMFPGY